MRKNNIFLSLGCLLWMGTRQAIDFAKKTGYDGLEFLPTRKSVNEKLNPSDLRFIKSLHQNWRLDIGLDKSYFIKLRTSILFIILRFLFFPKIEKSTEVISFLSNKLKIPVAVHGLSEEWTRDANKNEFEGGLQYEILGTSINPTQLKNWLKNGKHSIIIDSRDDQSLTWAKKYKFKTWQEFWKWVGLDKIKCFQLTLLGFNGLRAIKKHKNSLQEEQLLWLYKNNWKGDVVVEVNPLMLFFTYKWSIETGLREINQFIKRTLIEGKKWST